VNDFATRDELDAEVRAVRLQLQQVRQRLDSLDHMLTVLLRVRLRELRASPDPADHELADEVVEAARVQGLEL
jgi:hypothetical protein